MKKKVSRKYWIVFSIIILLILFFYPKECGNWGTSLETTYNGCSCFGLKITEPVAGGAPYYCLGICFNCRCVQYDLITKKLEYCKTGIECSSSIFRQPDVPIEIVKEYVPSNLSEIVIDGIATPCVNYDFISSGPRAVCHACGWVCALDSPFFWRFTHNEKELDIHVWNVQCMGTGLEYRLKGQGFKEGYKVSIGR